MRKIKKNKLEKNQITQQKLHELFEYHEAGYLLWKVQAANNVNPNRVAGSLNQAGYVRITIDGRDYKAHRLIYLYHHGHLPKLLDHIDTNKRNNRIENLRPCTHEENTANRGHTPTANSQHKNVYRLANGAYRVQFNRKRCNLKQDFQYETQAIQVATLVRNLLDGEFANHGTPQ